MANTKLFKIKYYGTFVLVGALTLFYVSSMILTQIRLLSLKAEYKNAFFDVIKDFDKVNIYSLSYQDEICEEFEGIGLDSETTILKISEMRSIITELGTFSQGRRERTSLTSINGYIDTQCNIELLLQMEQRYRNRPSEISESDKEKIVKAYINVIIFSDMIK